MRPTPQLVLALAWALAAASCTAEHDAKGDACQQVERARREAVDAYCAIEAQQCCFCACWGSTGYYDMETYLYDQSCECVAPPADETQGEDCEGEVLEEAEDCLDEIDACVEEFLAGKQLACEATPL